MPSLNRTPDIKRLGTDPVEWMFVVLKPFCHFHPVPTLSSGVPGKPLEVYLKYVNRRHYFILVQEIKDKNKRTNKSLHNFGKKQLLVFFVSVI